MSMDQEIFKGKTISDVFKDIYENSKKKDKQISSLIAELRPLVNDLSDATVIVPLIKDYLDVGVKNDDMLVKMASVFQRLQNSSQGPELDFDFSTIQDMVEESQKEIQVPQTGSQQTKDNGDV